MSSEPLVQLSNVSFAYDRRPILTGINMTIPRGKVVAIMGISGGGKTTTLRLIGGQLQGHGRAKCGLPARTSPNWTATASTRLRRRMGMLFQFGALFTDMSVYRQRCLPDARAHRSAGGHDPRPGDDEAACRRPARRRMT